MIASPKVAELGPGKSTSDKARAPGPSRAASLRCFLGGWNAD
jgi:hypothetical protein